MKVAKESDLNLENILNGAKIEINTITQYHNCLDLLKGISDHNKKLEAELKESTAEIKKSLEEASKVNKKKIKILKAAVDTIKKAGTEFYVSNSNLENNPALTTGVLKNSSVYYKHDETVEITDKEAAIKFLCSINRSDAIEIDLGAIKNICRNYVETPGIKPKHITSMVINGKGKGKK